MAAPTFVAAGTSNAQGSSAPMTVPYPTGGVIQAGDLLILQYEAESASGDMSATIDSGFTLLWESFAQTRLNSFVFVKKAIGNETGNVTISPSATVLGIGRIYVVRDWLDDPTWENNFEGMATGNGSDASIEQPSLTTTGSDRLCMAFITVADDNLLDPFTGTTGGTWSEPVAEVLSTIGDDAAAGIQIATLAAAGTISGGVDTMAAADPWFARVFAIKPAAAATPNPPRPKIILNAISRSASW